MAATTSLERLFSVTELWSMGYGSKNGIRALIADGTVPAVKVNNKFKIRESDLVYLAVPCSTGTPWGYRLVESTLPRPDRTVSSLRPMPRPQSTEESDCRRRSNARSP